jgi:hypothetical protein
MTKLNLTQIAKSVQLVIKQHQPEILTGLGIGGMITATVMAVSATPKALDLMAEIKEKHSQDTDRKAYAKDVVKKVAPVYLPATLVGGVAIGCLVGASTVNYKRNAALATAYTLSEKAMKEYQEKVVETIGAKKEQTVRSAIVQDKLDQNPVTDREVYITGKGDTLFYDIMSGRYFESDIEKVKKAVNELNHRLLREDYVSINDLYDEIGLSFTKMGDEMGWRVDKGLIEVEFIPKMSSDGRPCIALDYNVVPDYNYKY